MKFIPLPPLEELKEYLDYNPDTGILTWIKNRGCMKKGQQVGSLHKGNTCVYLRMQFKGKPYVVHRLAYFIYHGIDPLEKNIDHRDGNGLNNKITNLRLATASSNGHNRSLSKNNTSGKSGVSWMSFRKYGTGRWIARITFNNECIYLGSYVNKKDAIQVRNEAEKKYYGEFRRQD